MKPSSDDGDEPARRGRRWKRTLLLVLLLVSITFVAVIQGGHPAASKADKTGKAAILAVLMDPLSLFAERSPGGRSAGPLLSTKPGLGPEERVLSEVRDRDPFLGDPPGDLVSPVTPETLAANTAPPGGGAPSDDPFLGAPSQVSPFSFGNDPPLIPGGGGGGFGGGGPGGILPPGGGGVTAVPEPATWAMMILGFFAVGAALRRRAHRKTGLSCAR